MIVYIVMHKRHMTNDLLSVMRKSRKNDIPIRYVVR